MRDLISRQAAIDALAGWKISPIVLAPVPSEPQWIPCSERLPEAGKYVLRTIRKFGWHGEEYWSVDIGPYNTNDGSIIAWMPLPEPYKEGEE